MNSNILIVAIVAAVLYVMATGNATTTTTTQVGRGCLQSIQQQYSSQWADMNSVQRALVGLRASACEEGR